MSTTSAILAEAIRRDGGTQSRAEIDQAVVEQYADAMSWGAEFPPVEVYYDGSSYWLADGFHRLAALERNHDGGEPLHVPAIVHQGGRREAVLHACRANATHGLQRKRADVQRAIEAMLRDEEWGRWSDRQIARHIGCDHKTVAARREDLVARGEIPHLEEREGADKKVYALPQRAEPFMPEIPMELRDWIMEQGLHEGIRLRHKQRDLATRWHANLASAIEEARAMQAAPVVEQPAHRFMDHHVRELAALGYTPISTEGKPGEMVYTMLDPRGEQVQVKGLYGLTLWIEAQQKRQRGEEVESAPPAPAPAAPAPRTSEATTFIPAADDRPALQHPPAQASAATCAPDLPQEPEGWRWSVSPNRSGQQSYSLHHRERDIWTQRHSSPQAAVNNALQLDQRYDTLYSAAVRRVEEAHPPATDLPELPEELAGWRWVEEERGAEVANLQTGEKQRVSQLIGWRLTNPDARLLTMTHREPEVAISEALDLQRMRDRVQRQREHQANNEEPELVRLAKEFLRLSNKSIHSGDDLTAMDKIGRRMAREIISSMRVSA